MNKINYWNKKIYNVHKVWPNIGQQVYVLYFTDNFVSMELVGICLRCRFDGINSTITVGNEFSRQEFFFNSPLVLRVEVDDEPSIAAVQMIQHKQNQRSYATNVALEKFENTKKLYDLNKTFEEAVYKKNFQTALKK